MPRNYRGNGHAFKGGPMGLEVGGGVSNETLAANKIINRDTDPQYLRLDPAGARDLTLPAENLSKGVFYEILNLANAAEAITVKDDGGSTIVTISQDEKCTVVCDGTTWRHMGIISIALT